MWYLTQSEDVPTFSVMAELIDEGAFDARLRVSEGEEDTWERLDLVGNDDSFAVEIDRLVVRADQPEGPGMKEVRYFLEEIEAARPASAVPWLRRYLQQVRTVYYLRLYGGHERWSEPIYELRDYLDNFHRMITYCELEGWSNDMGEHITWEFADSANGVWWMGLLIDGKWNRFQMELEDKAHQESFKNGQVPRGVKVKQRRAE
jgi:hypothetical protein